MVSCLAARQLDLSRPDPADRFGGDGSDGADIEIGPGGGEPSLRRSLLQHGAEGFLQQIAAQTANLATLAASKVIRRELRPEDQRQLVDEALAELSRGRRKNGQG